MTLGRGWQRGYAQGQFDTSALCYPFCCPPTATITTGALVLFPCAPRFSRVCAGLWRQCFFDFCLLISGDGLRQYAQVCLRCLVRDLRRFLLVPVSVSILPRRYVSWFVSLALFRSLAALVLMGAKNLSCIISDTALVTWVQRLLHHSIITV